MQPWAVGALAALHTEREKLQVRLAQIDAGIAAIQALTGGGVAAQARANGDTVRPTGAPSEFDKDILAALQNGKTTMTELMKSSRSSMYLVGKSLKRLVAAKQIEQRGAGRSTSYHPR